MLEALPVDLEGKGRRIGRSSLLPGFGHDSASVQGGTSRKRVLVLRLMVGPLAADSVHIARMAEANPELYL
jgi:hypothetical protein